MHSLHELFSSRSSSSPSPVVACTAFLDSHWRGFRVARRLLPAHLRDDLITLLAWFSIVRERMRLAGTDEEHSHALDALNGVVEEAFSNDPALLLAAGLRGVVRNHGLERQLFTESLAEYESFVSVHTFETRPVLTQRARKLTLGEGRALLRLLGLERERSQVLAEKLGIALILTHWLDSFPSEFSRGRLHFAMDDLARHAVRIDALHRGEETSATRALVQSQTDWAREQFERGWPLCRDLGPLRGRMLAFVLRWQAARLTARESRSWALFGEPTRGGFPRLLACGLAILVSRRAPRFQ